MLGGVEPAGLQDWELGRRLNPLLQGMNLTSYRILYPAKDVKRTKESERSGLVSRSPPTTNLLQGLRTNVPKPRPLCRRAFRKVKTRDRRINNLSQENTRKPARAFACRGRVVYTVSAGF
jgi:hypothetical protein